MFKKIIFPVWIACMALVACNASSTTETTQKTHAAIPDSTVYGTLDTAVFAAGCFWCVEAMFERLKGVKEAVSGYSGGTTKNPTYEQVCSHTTGHAEAVEVYYDPEMISYTTLLQVYFAGQDPTQVDGQGPDHGDSYRSVIFYRNEDERIAAEAFKAKLDQSGAYTKPIAVIIEPLKVFYMAEAYHQNYEHLHPENPYVQRVSIPRIKNVEQKFPNLLK